MCLATHRNRNTRKENLRECVPTPLTCSNASHAVSSPAASSPSSLMVSWMAKKTSARHFPGSAFRVEQPLSAKEQPAQVWAKAS